MKKLIKSIFWWVNIVVYGLLTQTVFAYELAQECRAEGIGALIDNSNMLIVGFNKLIIIGGCSMIIGSFFQYASYRQNSMNVKLSQPVMLLVCGIGLIAISFVPFPRALGE